MAELNPERLQIARWNHQELSGGERIPEENFVEGDLRSTWRTVVERWKKTLDGDSSPSLLSACPPCQGMSTARSGLGQGDDLDAGKQDERNLLVRVIADVAQALSPKVIVVENVPAFLTRQVPHPDESGEGVSAARLLCHDLEDQYEAFPFLADMADYNVPQHRQRTFLTFIRTDLGILDDLEEVNRYPYPPPKEEQITLREFLEELEEKGFPKLDADENTSGEHPMDEVPSFSEERRRMIEAIDEPGGSAWQNDCDKCGFEDIDEDEARCPQCDEVLPRPTIEDEEEGVRLIKGFRRSSYRRMPLDQPAPTVTTASNRTGSDYTIHPTEDRLLSPRECAALQKFPDDFVWEDPETGEHAMERFGSSMVREVIGEAVPPEFTRQHGEVLVALLENDWNAEDLIPAADERCAKAKQTLGFGPSLFDDAES